jgi:hypothetical protein
MNANGQGLDVEAYKCLLGLSFNNAYRYSTKGVLVVKALVGILREKEITSNQK